MYKNLIFAMFGIIMGYVSCAQGNGKEKEYEPIRLTGTLKSNDKAISGVIVTAYSNKEKVASATSNSFGKFTIDIAPLKEYVIEFAKQDIMTRNMSISGNVPASELGGLIEHELTLPIDLYINYAGLNVNKMKEPVAKVKWLADDEWLSYDDKYNAPNDEVKKTYEIAVSTLYTDAVQKAKELESQSKYEEAWLTYQQASAYKPKEKEPLKKIDEIKKIIAQNETSEESYKNAIEKGDKLFAENNFTNSKAYYNKALSYKPKDPAALSKISIVEAKQQQLFAEKRSTYDSFLAQADAFVKQEEFEEALLNYKEAAKLFSEEQLPKDKIEQMKSKTSDEKAYAKFVAKADAYLGDSKYESAEKYYQRALDVKPGDAYATGKIKEIKDIYAQIEVEKEKQKELEEKYTEIVAKADQNFAEKKYQNAMDVYMEALSMKPDQKEIKNKINKLDQMIADEKENKVKEQKEAEYKKVIAAGDNLFDKQDYSNAEKKYLAACKVKPGDVYATKRIREIKDVLAAKNLTASNNIPSTNNSTVNTTEKQNTSATENTNKTSDTDSSSAKGNTNEENGKQTNGLDKESLLEKIQKAEKEKNEDLVSELYLQLAESYTEEDNSGEALTYYFKSLDITKETKNQQKESEVLNKIGSVYHMRKELANALEYYEKALQIKELSGDKAGTSDVLNEIAIVYYDSGRYETSIEYYEKSLIMKTEVGDKVGAVALMQEMGKILESTYRYDKSLEYYEKSLKIVQEQGDEQSTTMILNNIGNVYNEQNEVDKAIEFYEKSLAIDRKLEKKKDIAASLNNIGVMYYNKGEYKSSEKYYAESIEILEVLGDKKEMSISYNNMGNINFDWEKFDKALEYYEKSLKIKEELHYMEGVANSLHNIGNVHKKMNDYKKAIEYYDKSNDVAEKNSYTDINSNNYAALAEVYAKMKEFEKAYDYYKKYTASLNLLTQLEKKQVSEIQSKYEVISQGHQISKLKKEVKKQKLLAEYEASSKQFMLDLKDAELKQGEEKMKKQQILIYSFVIGFILILLFSIMLYRQYSAKKKANILLASQNEEIRQAKEEIEAQRDEIQQQRDFVLLQKDTIEFQKQEITDSIIYASRIQRAVLPPTSIIESVIPEHFVLYKPRDIVSGDFYWMTLQEGKAIIVAADCTGHGVPGAFMSMLGVSFLNEIVIKKQITKSDEILNELRAAVISSLHQTGKEGEAKDGMDIALCVIDENRTSIEFSGANNPLFIIRSNELLKFTSDRMPIGIHGNDLQPFTSIKEDLKKDDVLYIFSDGFADQFGGDSGKKLKTSNFKNLLLDVNEKPMKEQLSELNSRFEEWKEGYDQLDDILLIGLRI